MSQKPHSFETNELIKAVFRIIDDINLIEKGKIGIKKPINVYDTLLGEERFFFSFIVKLKDIVHNTVPSFNLDAHAKNDPSIRSYCPNTIEDVLESFNDKVQEQTQKGQYIKAAFQSINDGLREKEQAGISRPYAPSLTNPGYEKILGGVTALMKCGQFDLCVNQPVTNYHTLSKPCVLYDIVKKLKKELEKAAKNNDIIKERLKKGNYNQILKNVERGILKPSNRNQECRLDPETMTQVIYSQEKHTTYHKKDEIPIGPFPQVTGRDAERYQKIIKYFFNNIFGSVECTQEKMADESGLPLKIVKECYTPSNPILC